MTSEQARLDSIATHFRTDDDFNGTISRYGVRSLRPWLRGSCLELGAADGAMTDLLLDEVDELVVVEAAQHFVDDLRARFSGVRVDCSLVEHYEPARRFDCVIAAHLLEHVEDDVAVAARIREWVEPDGHLLVVVPNAHSFNRLMGARMGLLDDCHDLHAGDLAIGHRRVYDHDSLSATLRRAGWKIEHLGGVMFKPVSNGQMRQWFDPAMVEACWALGNEFPRNAGDVLAVCTP